MSAPCTWKPRHLQPGSGWERAPEAGERERPEALPAALPRCGPGPERSARGQGGAGEDNRAREWTLVRALGAARGAPPDGAYLAARAARGSWVRLLAEADSQAYPLRLVRPGPRTLIGYSMPPTHMRALGLCRMVSADSNGAERWERCGGALGAVERGADRAACRRGARWRRRRRGTCRTRACGTTCCAWCTRWRRGRRARPRWAPRCRSRRPRRRGGPPARPPRGRSCSASWRPPRPAGAHTIGSG